MVLGVLETLGYVGVPLSLVSADPSICGIGVSDDRVVAKALYDKFHYVNTFLHQYPTLDIRNVTDEFRGTARFVTCSDVLEHVPPPAERALAGLRSLISSDGAIVISVPHVPSGETQEFYPGLVEYDIRGSVLRWKDTDGMEHCDESPEFHGGSGLTLAFRLWSLEGLTASLYSAGFRKVSFVSLNSELGVPPLGPGDAVVVAHG